MRLCYVVVRPPDAFPIEIGALLLPSATESAGNVSGQARFALLLGSLSACPVEPAWLPAAALCAGAEVGQIEVEGSGFAEDNRSVSDVVANLLVSALYRPELVGGLHLRVAAVLAAPLIQRSYAFEALDGRTGPCSACRSSRAGWNSGSPCNSERLLRSQDNRALRARPNGGRCTSVARDRIAMLFLATIRAGLSDSRGTAVSFEVPLPRAGRAVSARDSAEGRPPPTFAEVFEGYAAYVLGLLPRLRVPAADVQDVAQEVFLAIAQGLAALRAALLGEDLGVRHLPAQGERPPA